jgi:hypothetical protein
MSSVEAPNSTVSENTVNPAVISAVSADAPAGLSFDVGTKVGACSFPKPQLLYFRLKAVQSSSSASAPTALKFPSSNTLCPALLQQLSSIPLLAKTGLFAAGNILLTISRHTNALARNFFYTAAFSAPNNPESLGSLAELILEAQAIAEIESPSLKGFSFILPIITPKGSTVAPTRCFFALDRNLLITLTTINFALKVPSSISVSPAEDFALLVSHIITPRENRSDTDYLALTLADRTRFAKFCRTPKITSSKHGDYAEDGLSGTFALCFEDANSRDIPIWNCLIFASIFGLDPRFGHHQQFVLYIPIVNDLKELDKRPVLMKNAVINLRANHELMALLPSKPLRNKPKTSEASTSESESEALFLENISRRSEALLLLPPVPPVDSLLALQYIPLDDITFVRVLNIPAPPSLEVVEDRPIVRLLPDGVDLPLPFDCVIPPLNAIKPEICGDFLRHSCNRGTLCHYSHLQPFSASSRKFESMPASAIRKDAAQPVLKDAQTVLRQSSVELSDNFVGEGKRDQLCIKFSNYRCLKGDRCPYSHDLRALLSALELAAPTKLSPVAAAKLIDRAKNASPSRGGRGDAQFERFINMLESARPKSKKIDSNLTAPGHSVGQLSPKKPPSIQPISAEHKSTPSTPVKAEVVSHPDSSAPHLSRPANSVDIHSLSEIDNVASAAQTSAPIQQLRARTLLTVERLSRSLATDISKLNGFCSSGHRIFKKPEGRKNVPIKCSFCKQSFTTEIFTCSCAASKSCLNCLRTGQTAPPPPTCPNQACVGICTIHSLTKASQCHSGHTILKNIGSWHCNVCKFISCRDCVVIKDVNQALHALKIEAATAGNLLAHKAQEIETPEEAAALGNSSSASESITSQSVIKSEDRALVIVLENTQPLPQSSPANVPALAIEIMDTTPAFSANASAPLLQ